MDYLPEGWDLYDPNAHELSDNPTYKLARKIAHYDAKERLFRERAGLTN